MLSWEHIPGVQPAIVLDEFVDCEAAVRADPRWQDALRKRGVTDPSLAMVDSWSAGNFGFPADEGRRLVRALTWVHCTILKTHMTISRRSQTFAKWVEQ